MAAHGEWKMSRQVYILVVDLKLAPSSFASRSFGGFKKCRDHPIFHAHATAPPDLGEVSCRIFGQLHVKYLTGLNFTEYSSVSTAGRFLNYPAEVSPRHQLHGRHGLRTYATPDVLVLICAVSSWLCTLAHVYIAGEAS